MKVKTKKALHVTLWCELGVLLLLAAVALFALFSGSPTASTAPTGGTTQSTEASDPTDAATKAPEETLPENPYGPEDFIYEGDYLSCISGESVLGIDISTFQKNVDWEQVKAAGIDFVIIRLGYRGTNIGVLFEDEDAQAHYQGAIRAGLKVGGYFFSQAITPEEAQEEAEFCLSITDGWNIQMPIVFDWEHIDEDCRTVNMTPRLLTDCALAFCQTIQQAGYKSMIYFNQRQADDAPLEGYPVDDRFYLQELTDYGLWLAMYEDLTFPYKIDMWQYSCSGTVPGISGAVDLNLYFPYDPT